mgnify:CR=1 FL=1
MNKERIRIGELFDLHNVSDLRKLPGFTIIQNNYTGDSQRQTIIQRVSDNKYFKIYWSQLDVFSDTLYRENGYEVFPKQITTTIYE